MIPNYAVHEMKSSPTPAVAFTISQADAVHIMRLLRSTLYSDKIGAVIREYSANAWDAHREAQLGLVPIRVRLPTTVNPIFEVRDFGPGIPHDEMATRFCAFGASTKRQSNDAVGCFGIGCKSGWAYTQDFTVVSRCNGWCRTYVAALDAFGQGQLMMLREEQCDPSNTGLTIQVVAKPGDIGRFAEYARKFYSWFSPRPDIDVDLPQRDDIGPEGRVLPPGVDRCFVAIMGCVAYPVDITQLTGVHSLALKRGFELRFGVGELDVAASREALEYSSRTRKAIEDRLEGLTSRLLASILREVREAPSDWDRRIVVLRHLPDVDPLVLAPWSAFRERATTFLGKTTAFMVLSYCMGIGWRRTHKIWVDVGRRLVVLDDAAKRSWKRYEVKTTDLVVVPAEGASRSEARDALMLSLRVSQLEGVPIVDMSSLRYYPVVRSAPAIRAAPVHPSGSVFELEAPHREGAASWKRVERQPSKGDVYVLLDRWSVSPYENFYRTYLQDSALLDLAGEKMPAIVGYRGERGAKLAAGTPYADWRKGTLDRLLRRSKAVRELRDDEEWRNWDVIYPPKEFYQVLPDKHPVRLFFERQELAHRRRPLGDLSHAAKELPFRWPTMSSAPQELWADIRKRWPLLGDDTSSLKDMCKPPNRGAWIDYLLRRQPRSKKK